MVRVGQGFDAHRFQTEKDQRPLILAGVRVEHPYGLEAHSDGDVVIHALCDALLGAAGLPDIGHFFPDTDAHYKNADSAGLLQQVMATLREKNWDIGNVDITIIAQQPKIAAYMESMKQRLSGLMAVEISSIALKATTTEKMGFTGRGEGIATLAIALIQKT